MDENFYHKYYWNSKDDLNTLSYLVNDLSGLLKGDALKVKGNLKDVLSVYKKIKKICDISIDELEFLVNEKTF